MLCVITTLFSNPKVLAYTGPSPTLEQNIYFLVLCSALAHLGLGPFGPVPVWALGLLSPGLFGPGPFPFRDQFLKLYTLPVPMLIPMPGPIPLPMLVAYEGP